MLLYGRTRAGKTAQLGELAEHVYKTEGKRTRLYTADRGGIDTIRPHIDLGIVEVVALEDSDPWIFLNKAVRGCIRDGSRKWVLADNSNIGVFAFESMTSIADELMASMAQKAAENISIGGGANISFNVSGDGESLKVSGSNMAHYGVAQQRITSEVWQSQRLPASYIVWTAGVSKDDDTASSAKVLGPQVVGKALTAEVPRWFNLTFRIDCIAAQGGKPERHILYLGNSVDLTAGNAVGLGNTRTPLGAPDLPTSIEPASIVQAIMKIDEVTAKASESIKRRMAITGGV